jgi:hypothetical protein
LVVDGLVVVVVGSSVATLVLLGPVVLIHLSLDEGVVGNEDGLLVDLVGAGVGVWDERFGQREREAVGECGCDAPV